MPSTVYFRINWWSFDSILDYIKPKHSDTNDDDEEDNDENGENARERAKIISELYKNNPFWNKSNASDSDHLNGDGDNSNDGDAKDDDYYEFGFRHRRDLSMLDNVCAIRILLCYRISY